MVCYFFPHISLLFLLFLLLFVVWYGSHWPHLTSSLLMGLSQSLSNILWEFKVLVYPCLWITVSKLKSGYRFLNAVVLGHSAKLLPPALVSDQFLYGTASSHCPMSPSFLPHILLPPEDRHFPALSSLLLPALLSLSVVAMSLLLCIS